MIDDPHRALLIALTEYLGPIEIDAERQRDWWSATFTGMRHELSFTTTASAARIDALPEIDLPMRGHFVADLAILDVQPGRPTRLSIEALTIRAD